MSVKNILVVDDEVGIRELLFEILKDEGYEVRLAEDAATARTLRREQRPDLVLLDIWMPDTDGITLLKEWAANGQLTMPVVMMSGHGTIESAMEATRIGACDFLEKPISLPRLLATVNKALAGGNVLVRPQLQFAHLGRAKIMQELHQRIEQVSRSQLPLLLVGELGCGFPQCIKLLQMSNSVCVAPTDHAWLGSDPLDTLNEARDGLLVVSEVEKLTRDEQAALQEALASLEKLNIRLVSTSHMPLGELVELGEFDEKLYTAIGNLTLRIPSLNEHAEDIPDIANTLLLQMIDANEITVRHFDISTLNALRMLAWPGNLATLQNVVKTLAMTSLGETIYADDVARVAREFGLGAGDAQGARGIVQLDLPLRQARELFEHQYLLHHIKREDGNMSRVAERIGLERTHLYRKLKQLGIRPGKNEKRD